MSQYVNFYVRVGDTFAPLGDFSRNNKVYRIASHYVPYGYMVPITYSDLSEMLSECDDALKKNHLYEEEINAQLEFLHKDNAPLKEKLNGFAERQEVLAEIKRDNDEIYEAAGYFHVLINVINSVMYDDYFDSDNYLYLGFECEPTVENIRKG
jgi:hypothetical protein